MIYGAILISCLIKFTSCNWNNEWMLPLQEQVLDGDKTSFKTSLKMDDGQDGGKILGKEPLTPPIDPDILQNNGREQSTAGLRMKLTAALYDAQKLHGSLVDRLSIEAKKENVFKKAIAAGKSFYVKTAKSIRDMLNKLLHIKYSQLKLPNICFGVLCRSGVSTVTVFTMNQQPRSYIVREGMWSLCSGVIQTPAGQGPVGLFSGILAAPRCIGQELRTMPDPCVFNSVIKYETLPAQRRMQYIEDDYFCLKDNFNTTVERYMSVPKRLINETCRNGVIRSLEENISECSMRILSEYNFYPERGASVPSVPLEYCTEKDGSCKLIVAWHLSNDTVENFEFLKNEPNFKKYFIKTEILT